MIVVDASAALAALLNNGPARRLLGEHQIHVPHLVDAEVASGLRRHVLSDRISLEQGMIALDTWRRLAATRYGVHGVLPRIWELHPNLSAYGAGYIALAETLECPLVTADARLSGAPGLRCTVIVVPR